MDLLVAITNDEYQEIMQGKKTMLARTLYPKKLKIGDRVYMHVRGVIKIQAVVGGLFNMSPARLWEKFSPAIHEERAKFDRRFLGRKLVVGISFADVKYAFNRQINIKQGYSYVCASIR